MYEEMNVKYLIVNLKYSAYIKLQIALIFTCLVGAVLCYQFARGGDTWFFKNSWWLFIVAGILEAVESLIAIKKAKNDYDANMKQSVSEHQTE